MVEPQPGSALPHETVALAELVFDRLSATQGGWTLTFAGKDGRLVYGPQDAILPDDIETPVRLLFVALDAARGEWTLTLKANNGRLRSWEKEQVHGSSWSRTQKGGPDELARFGT